MQWLERKLWLHSGPAKEHIGQQFRYVALLYAFPSSMSVSPSQQPVVLADGSLLGWQTELDSMTSRHLLALSARRFDVVSSGNAIGCQQSLAGLPRSALMDLSAQTPPPCSSPLGGTSSTFFPPFPVTLRRLYFLCILVRSHQQSLSMRNDWNMLAT